MINRREFVGITIGAGAALALTPELLFAQAPGTLIQRTHPSSGERFPVISFSPREEADNATMKNILKTLLDNGGKVVDVLHGGPAGEQAGRIAAAELGIQDKFFWTTPLVPLPQFVPGGPPPKPDPVATRAGLEQKFATFKVSKIDLVMVGSSADRSNFAYLREMKKEGRIRYIGVHHLAFPSGGPQPPFGALESMMRDEQIDFIGTDYSLGDRRLEEKILPLAQERKIGVLAYFPFDRGRMFQRASSTPLPDWAAEFDARTWAQFFLKYVISHPAVVMARTGTTKPAHLLENIGGGIGRLPDEATRKRMAALMDTFPPNPQPKPQAPQVPPGPTVALSAAILDRYVGEYSAASGFTAIFRRDGTTLFVKPGTNPEAALIARTETRFQDPRGPFFEFQLDGQGKVTGAVLEQQGPRGTQKLPLQRTK